MASNLTRKELLKQDKFAVEAEHTVESKIFGPHFEAHLDEAVLPGDDLVTDLFRALDHIVIVNVIHEARTVQC